MSYSQFDRRSRNSQKRHSNQWRLFRLICYLIDYVSSLRAVWFAFACTTMVCCCRLRAQNCVFQSPQGHPYSWKVTYLPQTGLPRGPALKVVAFGDSVVWGDGDKPKHKIVKIVSQRIADLTGRPVELRSYAHSAARLAVSDADSKPTFPVHNGKPLGDLDSERPTTSEQVDCAAQEDSDADYVLLDGCINEIGAEHIALPPVIYPPSKRISAAEIRSEVLNYCSANMANTLITITHHFRNAHVVVLDYFRVVSKASEPKPADTEAERKQQGKENAQRERNLERVIKKEKNMESLPGSGTPEQRAIQAWTDNSDEFLKDTTSCFKWAIDAVNAGAVGPISNPQGVPYTASDPESIWPAVCPSFSAQGTVIGPKPPIPIVPASFPDNQDYSYGAPNTHLWLLPDPFINPDELYWRRAWECLLHPFRGDTACFINPIAHPKYIGAQCYSESILNAVGFAISKPDPNCQSAESMVAAQ